MQEALYTAIIYDNLENRVDRVSGMLHVCLLETTTQMEQQLRSIITSGSTNYFGINLDPLFTS